MAQEIPPIESLSPSENRRRMIAGELYYASTPELAEDRRQCRAASHDYNTHSLTGESPRRRLVAIWRYVVRDDTRLPPPAATTEEDDALFAAEPWVDGPIKLDYGYNVKLGPGVYVNANSTWIDTCPITVGARTLIGPNCSFYSGTHPLNPHLRNGLKGPESGKPIVIGEDCWLGGNCVVLPGVTIGRGVTVGAGSVVTKDVSDYVVIAGNPAKVIKHVDLGAQK